MADRISTAQIKTTFEHYLKAFGFKAAPPFKPGMPPHSREGLFLDHNATYGGWEIRGHSKGSGGEHQPIRATRMGTREFYEAMWFAIRSMDAKKNKAAGTGL